MIYIQKKSTAQPITGKIVDTLNIEDREKNTYSARIIDEKVAEAGSISDVTVNGTSVVSDKVAKITLSTVATSGSYNDLTNKPTIPSVGTITTQVKSYTSGEISVYDTGDGNVSFTAAGPGSGWYPTCATVPHGKGTTTLGSGIYSKGITMTSAGNNTCSGTIYASGNSGNASTNRGKCTYYVTWAKLG